MAKSRSFLHLVATTLMIAAIGALAGLPFSAYAQNRPAPQIENYQLEFRLGNPSFQSFELPWQSPNLFQVIQQSGIDVDQMLATAGYNVDWLLAETGETTDFILESSQVNAQFLLDVSGNTSEWLITQTGRNADWILSNSGNNIVWLLDRTGGTADQLLEWADQDADWLLDELDEDADWILDRSGYSLSTMLGWAGGGANWVAGVVRDVLCGNLSGAPRTACNVTVNAVADSVSGLVDLIDESADWWLDRADKDIDWLIGRAGKSADWMLSEAGRSRSWLWEQLGQDADWLLAQAGKSKSWLLTLGGNNVDWLLNTADLSTSWLFERIGGSADWLLGEINRDADWLLGQLGWRLNEAELRFMLNFRLAVIQSNGLELGYAGASRLQYVPGTPLTPRYDRRSTILGGNFKAAEGLGATNATVNVTYEDPTGVTVTQGGDAGILNQDLEISIDDNRRILSRTRHSDDWLMTFCIPLKEIVALLLVEVPPASAAAMNLLPDIMMQVVGDVGYQLSNEQLDPPISRIEFVTLPQPQSFYEFLMAYQGQIGIDARLTGGSWGFAWGLPCTFGAGISMGYNVPGGQSLMAMDPASFSMRAPVRFQLRLPSDRQPPQGQQPTPRPRPGTPRPGTPVRPPPQTQPQPVPQPAEPVSPQPTPTQPVQQAPQQEPPKPLQQLEQVKTDKN